MTIDLVPSLTNLLAELADGERGHGMGITLENLDNPGWSLRICISGTRYASIDFPKRMIDRSETDWVALQVSQENRDRFLCACCGVGNLQEAAELVFETLSLHTGGAP